MPRAANSHEGVKVVRFIDLETRGDKEQQHGMTHNVNRGLALAILLVRRKMAENGEK